MMGGEGDRGLIPRICANLFSKMVEGTKYRVEVSYLEIYNERVKDLLQNDSFLAGKSFGISDLVLYSHLKQIPNKKLSKEFLSWMTKCDVFLSAPEKSQNGQNKTETSGDKRDELFTFF